MKVQSLRSWTSISSAAPAFHHHSGTAHTPKCPGLPASRCQFSSLSPPPGHPHFSCHFLEFSTRNVSLSDSYPGLDMFICYSIICSSMHASDLSHTKRLEKYICVLLAGETGNGQGSLVLYHVTDMYVCLLRHSAHCLQGLLGTGWLPAVSGAPIPSWGSCSDVWCVGSTWCRHHEEVGSQPSHCPVDLSVVEGGDRHLN